MSTRAVTASAIDPDGRHLAGLEYGLPHGTSVLYFYGTPGAPPGGRALQMATHWSSISASASSPRPSRHVVLRPSVWPTTPGGASRPCWLPPSSGGPEASRRTPA